MDTSGKQSLPIWCEATCCVLPPALLPQWCSQAGQRLLLGWHPVAAARTARCSPALQPHSPAPEPGALTGPQPGRGWEIFTAICKTRENPAWNSDQYPYTIWVTNTQCFIKYLGVVFLLFFVFLIWLTKSNSYSEFSKSQNEISWFIPQSFTLERASSRWVALPEYGCAGSGLSHKLLSQGRED